MTKTVTKRNAALLRTMRRTLGTPVRRPRSLTCDRCRKRFVLKPRGRERAYCSQTCRQRAYEARKAADHTPVLALKDDFNHYEIQRLVQQEVQAYLRSYLGELLAEQQLDHKLTKTRDADGLTLLKGGKPP